jgi:hypothetical protein
MLFQGISGEISYLVLVNLWRDRRYFSSFGVGYYLVRCLNRQSIFSHCLNQQSDLHIKFNTKLNLIQLGLFQ